MSPTKSMPLYPSPPPPPARGRSFGLTTGGVLTAIGGVRVGFALLDRHPEPVDLPAICLWSIGAALIALALLHPASLARPSRLWHRFGLLLAGVTNPIILLLLYATCILPVGLSMRAFGYDPLRLERDEDADTYWVAHEASPLDKPMRHQF